MVVALRIAAPMRKPALMSVVHERAIMCSYARPLRRHPRARCGSPVATPTQVLDGDGPISEQRSQSAASARAYISFMRAYRAAA
jgi:hypothetical protein